MPEIARNDDISVLPLSVRTSNCLRREQIHTIGAMIDYPDAALTSIRNMGAKSAEEVRYWVRVLQSGSDDYTLINWRENPAVPPNARPKVSSDCSSVKVQTTFVDQNDAITQDLPIANTSLSVRAKNALKNGGIEFVSQLTGLTADDLMAFKNMGRKSVDEIFAYLAKTEVAHHTDASENAMQLPENYKEIAFQMAHYFGQGESTWAQELLEIRNAYPEACGETLIYRLYDVPFTRTTVKAAILSLAETNGGEISKSSLMARLPDHLENTTIVEELLLELETASSVESGEIMVVRQFPSVVQFVSQLTDARQRKVLEARLAGETLQEIGEHNGGITRERVRQISEKGLVNRPRLREDQYAYLYDNYDFSEEDFLLAFDEPAETYNYLEMISTQSRSKRKPIDDLLTDTAVSVSLRRKAEKAVYKQYITIEGVRVRKRRAELVKYFVKTLCKTLTKFDDFVEFYNNQIGELGFSDDPSLLLESRTYENKLNGCDYVLWNQWRSFRYYNIPEKDYEELLSSLNLDDYENIEISSRKLYMDYPDLMEQYDIRDEYELHNLLKKIWTDSRSNVNFKKMPTIEIGKANRDNQVLALLLQYAPISNTDFAQKYEETYGVRATTVLANYMAAFDEYFFAGMYSITADNLHPHEFSRMRAVLCEDYYSLPEVKRLYAREFPDSDIANINAYVLKTLGFHVYTGYSGYIVKNTYAGATDYFNFLLTQTDIVDMRQNDASIRRIETYNSELYRLRADYEIVEFSPLQYINIRRLNAVGVEKEDLRNYCQAVAAFYEKGEYFTVTSMRKSGFTHDLDELGFDEWFYASVLLEDREKFSYQRIGGTRVFLRGKSGASLGGMLVWLLEQQQKIDFYDLMELLESNYGIILPKEKLLTIINGADLYYDTIMEAVYIDYDTYFEEI